MSGNPAFDEGDTKAATAGATHVLLTRGHFDHASDVLSLSRDLEIPVAGCFDPMNVWAETEGVETLGFSKGGTVDLIGVAVTMVNASHFSSMPGRDSPIYAGAEIG